MNKSKIQKDNKNKENKENKNKPKIKKAKTPSKILEKKKEKVLNKKGIQIKYSDFDGSGYIKNYSGVTRPGKDVEGRIKINQDTLVCLTNINNIKDFNIFGVLDGHGPEGHFVAEYISNYIPSQIINHPEIKNLGDTEEIYKKFKENNCKIITQAFIDADKQLENVEFNTSESGTTCCLVIHIGKHIMCANTGDSRAIVTFDESKNNNSEILKYLQCLPLSVDYKPDLPEEANRIIMSGGVVEQMTDEFGRGVGPMRVWAKDSDYPGLAMSRSIGDLKGKTVGIIPDPGIFEYDLNKTTKFILVCSDGVWEYLNNEKAKDLGKKFYLKNNASEYCHTLVSEAFNEWEKKDQFVDDITAVVVFF
jgi:serine/threonine protein phosphatase PrpC